MLLYILIFGSLQYKRKVKIRYTKWLQEILKISMIVISSRIQFLFAVVFSKHVKFSIIFKIFNTYLHIRVSSFFVFRSHTCMQSFASTCSQTLDQSVFKVSLHITYLFHKKNLVLGKVSGAFAKLRKATISFVVSVRPSVRVFERKNSAPTGRIFMKFGV